jgi:hypothetical protein
LLPATAAGAGVIVTRVVLVAEHPNVVAVTVYVPPAAIVAGVITGFCEVLEKLLGPVHAYVVPPDDVRFNVPFWQTGLLLPELTTGAGVIATVVVLVAEQLPLLTVTV